MNYSMLGMPQGGEWLVILAIVILVFGASKLPDLARGTGQALRIFKAETRGLKDENTESASAVAETSTTVPVVQVQAIALTTTQPLDHQIEPGIN